MAIAVVVGNTIGSGIFAKPGTIAAQGGSFPLIIGMWTLGGVLCLLGALCLAELAVMLPRAGGLYVYIREAYGRLPAFLFGWQEFLFARPASTGALSVICVGALGKIVGMEPSPVTMVFSAALLIGSLTVVNVRGALWGGWMQAATTFIKCGFVLFVTLLPFVLELSGREVVDLSRYSATITPVKLGLASQAAAVLLAVMWAYNGWEGVAPVAEEVRDPTRNIPIALLGGIGLLSVLYIGANVAYHAAIPLSEMVLPENQTHVAEIMVSRLLGSFGGNLMSLGIVASTLGAINSNLLTTPRVTFAMGRDGLLSPRLGEVHTRYGTPAKAIILHAVMASLLVAISAILVQGHDYFRSHSVFDLLTNCVIFVGSIFYMMAVAAVIVLRVRQPQRDRPYCMPGYPWLPLIYLSVYLWFLISVFQAQPIEGLIGLVVIAAGGVYYRSFRASVPI
jgi:APA family basic amino acid/polyamine antiporter